jgi:hypothetical protein
MMRGALIFVSGAAMLALAGCAPQGELAIRPKATALAAGDHPVSFRVAEARAHFALGNVALAAEGFRKAMREDPASIEAMNGLAACYDRMGRFDLSRRYYEMALAVAPGDARLYANLALSLDMQGRTDDARDVRAEMASRLAAGGSASAVLVSVEPAGAPSLEAQPVIGDDAAIRVAVTQVVAPDIVAPAEAALPAAVAAPAQPAAAVSLALAPPRRHPDHADGPRLERLSMGEVALVTDGPIRWKPRLAERPRGTALASNALHPAPIVRLTLLNAARSNGLAARTRQLLQRRGFAESPIRIGNAVRVQRSSVILYPAGGRADAARVASHFGFALRRQPGADRRLVIVLGRDAAIAMARRRG